MDPTPAIPSPKLFNLSGQNVLITGATRGNVLIARMVMRK
jgi:2-deoxy-D-gluconate 3-dehydrogenase